MLNRTRATLTKLINLLFKLKDLNNFIKSDYIKNKAL